MGDDIRQRAVERVKRVLSYAPIGEDLEETIELTAAAAIDASGLLDALATVTQERDMLLRIVHLCNHFGSAEGCQVCAALTEPKQ